jgi:hypothetical protein
MVCRSVCVLLVEFRSKYIHASEEESATLLHQFWSFKYTLDGLKKKVRSIIDAGHRYMMIEKELGTGAFLVLGEEISETAYMAYLLIESRWLTYLGGPS